MSGLLGGFFSNETQSSTANNTSTSYTTNTTTTNVDQSQVQTNSQEISMVNSGNSSWNNTSDASLKALDSFNKNIQYAVGGSNYGPNKNDSSGVGGFLDNFFGTSTPSQSGNSMNKYILIALAGVAVWFFFIRKR